MEKTRNKFTFVALDLFFYCIGMVLTSICLLVVYATGRSREFEDQALQTAYLGWTTRIPLPIWILGAIIGIALVVGRFLVRKNKETAIGSGL